MPPSYPTFVPDLENETKMIEIETDIPFSCTNDPFSCTGYPFKSKNLKNNIIHEILTQLKTAS